jgi:predicted outer membrane repeat protein
LAARVNLRHFSVTGRTANLTLVSLTLADSRIFTTGDANGSAIALTSNSVGRFVSVTFRNNTVTSTSVSGGARGGAIYASMARLHFQSCTFRSNGAFSLVRSSGGAIFATYGTITYTMRILR